MDYNYDLTELRQMSGDDEEFVVEMLQAFLENNANYVKIMEEACLKEDWATVKFNAHKIKPSILLFKIENLRQQILDLNEFAGKEIHLEKIPELVQVVSAGMKVIFSKINDEIQKK